MGTNTVQHKTHSAYCLQKHLGATSDALFSIIEIFHAMIISLKNITEKCKLNQCYFRNVRTMSLRLRKDYVITLHSV